MVALVMGGIAYAVSDSGGAFFGTAPTATVSSTVSLIETVPASSTRFHVAVRDPKSDRDMRLAVDSELKQVKAVDVPKGWRVEALNDVSSGLRIESSEERGFKLTDGGEWNVALRSATGEAYTEPRLLGKVDDKHAIVIARTDRMQILNVSRVGQVIALVDVPENTNVFGLSGGAVWMASFTPGQGLESEPTGPSNLYRVSTNGQQEIVDRTKTAELFLGALSDGSSSVVWTDSGSFTALGSHGFTGSGRPLAWLEGKLLVAEGRNLFLYDEQGQKQDLKIELIGEPSTARIAE